MELLLPLLIVFMIGMMFVSSRQRRKQMQQQEALQNSIVVGDVVRMTCGVSGTVVDVDDTETIDIEIAEDVITTWLRAAVREKLTADAETTDGTQITDGARSDDDVLDVGGTEPAAVTAGAGTGGAAANGSSASVPSDVTSPPSDAVGGTPTSGAGSETSGGVSSPRSS